MSAEDNKNLVLRFLEQVWNQHDLTAIEETLATDYINHDASQGSFPPGPDAYRQVAARFLAGFPDLHTTFEQAVAEGDLVAIHMTDRGTHRGEFMGIAPTGKSIVVSGTALYRVAHGKITEEWINADSLGMLQQLGVMPLPPGTP